MKEYYETLIRSLCDADERANNSLTAWIASKVTLEDIEDCLLMLAREEMEGVR